MPSWPRSPVRDTTSRRSCSDRCLLRENAKPPATQNQAQPLDGVLTAIPRMGAAAHSEDRLQQVESEAAASIAREATPHPMPVDHEANPLGPIDRQK